ncbi:hypothetical protein BHM03_00041111, partial [Ensete ventricosum]
SSISLSNDFYPVKLKTPEVLELSRQIKEKLKEADAFGDGTSPRAGRKIELTTVSFPDFEGKTDSKIRILEVVEELKAQRADKQAILLLDAFNKDRASLPQPNQNPPQLATLSVLNPPDPRERGMIDEAQKALEEAEALKKLGGRQEPVLEPSKYSAVDVRITDQKLRVCDICGAFLSVYDNCYYMLSDRRLADHFGGKLHLGYMQIREKLAELQVTFANYLLVYNFIYFNWIWSTCFFLKHQCLHNLVFQEERDKKRKIDQSEDDRRSKERSRDHDRAGSRDRDINRDVRGDNRDRGREHDRRNKDHDRHYDRGHRDRDRGSDRSRSYDSRSRRSRSHSRDRARDYDRH